MILLEKENKSLREGQTAAEKSIKSTPSRRTSQDNNNLLEEGDADEEDAEDSDVELERCLYGIRSHGKVSQHRRANLVKKNAAEKAKGNLIPVSNSTSSLSSSMSMSNGLNLCDSLKLRSNMPDLDRADPNSNKIQTKYCEKCEIIDAELVELRQKCVDLECALDDANEKNFVLEKLNRSIEIENENFSYKVKSVKVTMRPDVANEFLFFSVG